MQVSLPIGLEVVVLLNTIVIYCTYTAQDFLITLNFIEHCGDKPRRGATENQENNQIDFFLVSDYSRWDNTFHIDRGQFRFPFPLDNRVTLSLGKFMELQNYIIIIKEEKHLKEMSSVLNTKYPGRWTTFNNDVDHIQKNLFEAHTMDLVMYYGSYDDNGIFYNVEYHITVYNLCTEAEHNLLVSDVWKYIKDSAGFVCPQPNVDYFLQPKSWTFLKFPKFSGYITPLGPNKMVDAIFKRDGIVVQCVRVGFKIK